MSLLISKILQIVSGVLALLIPLLLLVITYWLLESDAWLLVKLWAIPVLLVSTLMSLSLAHYELSNWKRTSNDSSSNGKTSVEQ